MKKTIQLSLIFVLLLSCFVQKSKEFIPSESKPIGIYPALYQDTNYIIDSKQISIRKWFHYPYKSDTIQGNWKIEEIVEDTLLNTKRRREFNSDTVLYLEETTIQTINGDKHINMFYCSSNNYYSRPSKMEKWLIDCNNEEILNYNNEDLTTYKKGLKKSQKYISNFFGKEGKKHLKLNFEEIINEVLDEEMISDNRFTYKYDLVLKDGKRIPYLKYYYNYQPDSSQIWNYRLLRKPMKIKLKPVELEFSEIDSIIQRIDSIKYFDDDNLHVLEMNNNLYLTVPGWKDVLYSNPKRKILTITIFLINVHNKKVSIIEEKDYNVIFDILQD